VEKYVEKGAPIFQEWLENWDCANCTLNVHFCKYMKNKQIKVPLCFQWFESQGENLLKKTFGFPQMDSGGTQLSCRESNGRKKGDEISGVEKERPFRVSVL
jgi:hypothetical protein